MPERIDPEVAAGLFDLVIELHRKREYTKALPVLNRLMASHPGMAALYVQRGSLLLAMKQFEGALSDFDQALIVDPLNVEGHFGRGAAFQAQANLHAAINSYDRALELQPDHAFALNNRALVLRELGQVHEAVQSYDAAIDLMPDCPDFRFGKGMCLLLLGSFQQGWPLYEWRKAKIRPVGQVPRSGSPWRGEPLDGKVLLIQAEQGLGDTIQFCRFGSLAHNLGAKVVLQVQDRLATLLETLPFPVEILGETAILPTCDHHAMLLSMPLHFRDTIPAAVPYLSAEPQRTDYWKHRLGSGGFKIGISWQGEKRWQGEDKPEDRTRSFALRLFQGISKVPGVRLISLQKGDGVEQLAALPDAMAVETLGDEFDAGSQSFLDTAAVMQSLDLVISADTAIAHLAGALGRPFWVALKHAPDWRWLLDREDSPWYPGCRLFRQKKPHEWDDVFRRMEAEIRRQLTSGEPCMC
ncbi:MAG TPA: tetratricopeptide repeat-containing glycosyltransferase family protein [Rhizomicrobium sp.]|jgi:tetratricopeptide (TPR) repeat protein